MARRTAAVKALEEQRQRFLACRALGHQWRHMGTIRIDDPNDAWRRPFGGRTGMVGYVSECINCTGQKVKWITRSGEPVNRYKHADGYLHDRTETDSPAPSLRDYRRTFVADVFG